MVQRLVVEQVALVGAPARVADHPGRATGERDRAMAGILEATQHDQADQVADVEAVGRGVTPVVEGHRPGGDRCAHAGP